jgi:hypothetical protein
MPYLHCHFCATSNPAGATFCSACGGQLNLAPCPHCEAVNELTAPVCHSCKGELLEPSIERRSVGGQNGGSGPEPSGADTGAQEGFSQSAAMGGLTGSVRDTHASTNHAAESFADRIAASIPQARLSPQSDELPPERARLGLEWREAVPADNAMVMLQEAPRPTRRNAAQFKRRLIAAGAGAAFLLAVGVLLHGPSRSPVDTPPAGSATPGKSTISSDSGGSAERATAVQEESTAAIPSSEPVGQSAMAAPKASRSSAACSNGAVALGLCASEPGQAQAATPITSSADIARPSAKDDATAGCNDAAAALGVCAAITNRGKN